MSAGAFDMERDTRADASAQALDSLTANMLELAALAMPRVEA